MSRSSAKEPWSSLALIRLNAFSFGITGFILAMDTVILPVFVLTISPEGLKNTYLAILGLSGLAMAALVQPVVGRLSDRTRSILGKRVPFLIWGTVFVCASLVGIRLAPNFFVLFGVWIFIQTNINIAYGPGLALIRDLVPMHRVGVASSLKIMSDAAGGMALIAVSGAMIANESTGAPIDWRWLTLAILGVSLVGGVAVTSITVVSRQAQMPYPQPVSDDSTAMPVMNPQLGLFLISRLLMITSIAAFQTYGLFFLRDVVGLEEPAQALGRMILVIGGALAVAVYISGWISDRIGRKPVVVIGATGAALSTLWMLTAESSTEVLMIASVIGASVGVLLSANWALANELGNQRQAGLHMGIVNLATIGGSALAKLLGPGIDLLNRASDNLGYQTLLVGCAGLFVFGAIILMPVKTGWFKEAKD